MTSSRPIKMVPMPSPHTLTESPERFSTCRAQTDRRSPPPLSAPQGRPGAGGARAWQPHSDREDHQRGPHPAGRAGPRDRRSGRLCSHPCGAGHSPSRGPAAGGRGRGLFRCPINQPWRWGFRVLLSQSHAPTHTHRHRKLSQLYHLSGTLFHFTTSRLLTFIWLTFFCRLLEMKGILLDLHFIECCSRYSAWCCSLNRANRDQDIIKTSQCWDWDKWAVSFYYYLFLFTGHRHLFSASSLVITLNWN